MLLYRERAHRHTRRTHSLCTYAPKALLTKFRIFFVSLCVCAQRIKCHDKSIVIDSLIVKRNALQHSLGTIDSVNARFHFLLLLPIAIICFFPTRSVQFFDNVIFRISQKFTMAAATTASTLNCIQHSLEKRFAAVAKAAPAPAKFAIQFEL